MGVLTLGDALNLARTTGVDLVEIVPNANPPVCRLVDFGKFRYEQAKKDKEAKKHHHANKVKEIQLSAAIDPHDFGVKLGHAIDFLCDEMKVKVTLKFRGREMAHQEFGFSVVQKFIAEIAPYGHPDAPPKLIGKGLTLMLSPLPRTKRARNPKETAAAPAETSAPPAPPAREPVSETPVETERAGKPLAHNSGSANNNNNNNSKAGFGSNPFKELDLNPSR